LRSGGAGGSSTTGAGSASGGSGGGFREGNGAISQSLVQSAMEDRTLGGLFRLAVGYTLVRGVLLVIGQFGDVVAASRSAGKGRGGEEEPVGQGRCPDVRSIATRSQLRA
jgi:hypothetical protein